MLGEYRTFHRATAALDVSEANSLGDLFPQRYNVPLAQVLKTVNNHCRVLAAFHRWQQNQFRHTASHPALLAGIIGLGCAIGVREMTQILSRITENELDHFVNWRCSLDNIRAANDAVVKIVDAMELPSLYHQTQVKLHTAGDGQKFEMEVKVCTPTARSNTLYRVRV